MTNGLEAERAVLGAVLFSPPVLDDIADVLAAVDFEDARHRAIFEAVQRLAQCDTPIDELTLADELRRTRQLDAAGGVAYVAALSQAVPTARAGLAYAKIVSENALRARLRAVLAEAAATAGRDDLDPPEAIARIEAALFALGEQRTSHPVRPLRAVMLETMRQLEAGERVGVPTGFASVDKVVGGLRPGELILLAARPSMGKTALAFNIARNAAAKGARVLVITNQESAGEDDRHYVIGLGLAAQGITMMQIAGDEAVASAELQRSIDADNDDDAEVIDWPARAASAAAA